MLLAKIHPNPQNNTETARYRVFIFFLLKNLSKIKKKMQNMNTAEAMLNIPAVNAIGD